MTVLDNIKYPVITEMHLFEESLNKALQSDNPLLSSVNEYVRQGNGKQMRPLLVLLSAKLCGEINQNTYECAVSLELLHTASLIHDDVVDDTMERRGKNSINAQWNNKIAVLSGDYMLSKSLLHATKTNNIRILELISNIGMQLSDGELLQLANKDITKITEEEYFNIIRKKTAMLFAACTGLGAVSANANEEQIQSLRNFGELLGICFQLKDDIFDYTENIHIGKPTGNDLRDGKVTLPLIYALRTSSDDEKERIIGLIKEKDFAQEKISEIMNFARDNGGIAYAEKQMEIYKDKALALLNDFPDNKYKDSLIQYADFVVERKN